MLRFVFALLLVSLAATSVSAQSLTPVGVWLDSSGRTEVEIAPCGDLLCGKIVWFRWPNDDDGLPMVDVKNNNPALRTRPLLGLAILYGLRRTGERTWEDGRFYYPDDGEDHRARMSILDDGTLRVRYYDLLPLFGETEIWTRIR